MRLGPFQLLFFFSAQCSFDNMEEIHQLCRFALTLKTVSEEIKPQTVEKNKCVSCNYYVILFFGGGGCFLLHSTSLVTLSNAGLKLSASDLHTIKIKL